MYCGYFPIDTFESEHGLQSFAFFTIAMLLGILFVYPLLHVPPAGIIPSLVSAPTIPSPRRNRESLTPPPESAWPTLAKLRHPAVYFLTGLRDRFSRYADSRADSEEFDRILDSSSSSEDEDDRLRSRLFGRPRLRSVNTYSSSSV